MRKLLFTLLFIGGFATVASAQKEFASVELPMRRAEDLVTVADDRGNVCIYFYQNNKLYFNLLSPTGEQIASQEIPYRWNQQPQILGTRVTDEEFIFYSRFEVGRRDYIRPFAIHRTQGTFRSIQDLELKKERNETFVGGFADAEHFYMLYTDRKNNLHLYRDSDYGPVSKRTFATKLPSTRTRHERESELVFVHPDMEQTVYTGHHRSKIYTRGDLIHMIFDGFSLKGKKRAATTEILTLNWRTGESDYRTLPYVDQKSGPSFNSFLYENTLFRLHLNRDSLNLTAYDFASLQPVKAYSFKGDEEISIKATPVQQRGAGSLFTPDNKIIEKTSKVMRNLSNGVPAVTVEAFNDSSISLTIGSYKAPKARNSNMQNMNRMVRTPDRFIPTSRGLFLMPGRWVPVYSLPYSSYYLPYHYYRGYYDPFFMQGSNAPEGSGTSTYFRAVLDNKTLSKVAVADSSGTVTLQDKLEKYEQELKQEPTYKTLYRYGNKLHYGYYDRRANTFRIVEFAQQ